MSFKDYIADGEARVALMVTEAEQAVLHELGSMGLVHGEVSAAQVGTSLADEVAKAVAAEVAKVKADLSAMLEEAVNKAKAEIISAVTAIPTPTPAPADEPKPAPEAEQPPAQA